jgi:hypothetical protein
MQLMRHELKQLMWCELSHRTCLCCAPDSLEMNTYMHTSDSPRDTYRVHMKLMCTIEDSALSIIIPGLGLTILWASQVSIANLAMLHQSRVPVVVYGVLTRQTYQEGTQGSRLYSGGRQTWNPKVKRGHETQIYTGSGYQDSVIPYILFGGMYIAPCAWVLWRVDGSKLYWSSPQAYGWLGAFFTKEGPQGLSIEGSEANY